MIRKTISVVYLMTYAFSCLKDTLRQAFHLGNHF